MKVVSKARVARADNPVPEVGPKVEAKNKALKHRGNPLEKRMKEVGHLQEEVAAINNKPIIHSYLI